jgi:methyl-accepting chemotaxis protein
MKSIRAKVTVSIILCSLISSVLISVISITYSSKTAISDAQTELAMSCENASSEINALVSRIEQSVNTISDIALENLDFARFQTDSAYVESYTESLRDDFVTFAEHTDGAICAYIRYNPDFTDPTSGIFLTRPDTQSEFTSSTPTDFSIYDKDDVAHVGWYYIPVENKAPIWMDPYLNENVNIYMVSYVVPLYVDGVSVGIIGMDIDFGQMTDYTDSVKVFDTGYSFIVDKNGIIQHHASIPAGTDLREYEGGSLAFVGDFMEDDANQSTMIEYTMDGESRYLTFSKLDTGMKLAMTVPTAEVKAHAQAVTIQTIGAMSLGLIISIVLGILIGSSISGPIKKITDIVKQTAALNFKKTKEGSKLVERKDETGSMARAVGEMRGVLRNLVSDMEQIRDHMLGNMEELDNVMKENNAVSEDNSATTQELAAGMEETTASANMIVSNIGTIQDNVTGIRNLSQNGQEESREVRDRARKLRDTTVTSSNRTMEMYESMRKRTDEAIEQSKVVAKINELTENIRNISSQTNLLALNANIEAARAGEAGRGFAVVATEIGTLASQTFQTVDGINQIVEEVNAAVNNMTDCIRVIMEFLDKTVVTDYNSFKEVGEKYEDDATVFADSMGRIYEEISELSEKIDNIAQAIDSVSDTINQSTEGINLIAEKSGDAVAKTAEGYDRLQENREGLQHLKEMIDKFEL